MTQNKELSLTISNLINAPVSQVFDAWLNPKTLAKFMLPKPGMKNPGVTLDAKTGGQFQIDMNVGDQIIPHTGEYLEIDRPNRLSFTWQSPFSGDGSQVTIDFRAVDKTTTEVTLNHVKFPDEENRDNHKGGWQNILEALNNIS